MAILRFIKRWAYGGDIKETVGTVRALSDGLTSSVELRVHVMSPNGTGGAVVVGVETVYRRAMNYQALAAMLPEPEARALVDLINEAIGKVGHAA